MNWIKVKRSDGCVILLNLDTVEHIDSAERLKGSSKLRFIDGSERIIRMTVEELDKLTEGRNCL
jgi:16S rRNA U1498 N3-methylase RsmE